jgi:gamma-carbonic anhydrase
MAALIMTVNGLTPQIGGGEWIAPNATIVGDVTMGANCTVWFNAVIRGDVNKLVFGDNCNIQDGAVVHATYQKAATTVGHNVSIGHNAIVHGCTIEDSVLVGMGAIIMDGAVIGQGSIIAAGAVVTQNTIVPPGSIYAGNPAKFLKIVAGENAEMIDRIAKNYRIYADWFR